jgi:hypothetical protein
MSVTTIITIVLVYAAFRAAIRPRKPDPMAGRLVHRSPPSAADIEAMKVEGSIRQREADERNQREWDARLKFEAWQGENYKRECAMRAWHAGYGPHP